MEMQDHALKPIWEKMPELFTTEQMNFDGANLTKLIADFFVAGTYYYYLIDIADRALSQQHENICRVHGLSEPPLHLQQIIDLIHPDDLRLVLQAEEACHQKLLDIGLQFIQSYKVGYCFRMRVADGSYHLFHHQSISIAVDAQYRIAKSLNIHTDIQHITSENSSVATITGINGCSDFHVIDLKENTNMNNTAVRLTAKERRILVHLAQGLSSTAIARTYGISTETVRVHRKNLLRKTQTSNSSALIRRCVELGLL